MVHTDKTFGENSRFEEATSQNHHPGCVRVSLRVCVCVCPRPCGMVLRWISEKFTTAYVAADVLCLVPRVVFSGLSVFLSPASC